MSRINDGDNDSVEVKRAKNAIVNGIKAGKIKKPDVCDKCGKKTKLEAHHHKGYDEENMTNVKWLCIPCRKAADNKLRAIKRKKKNDSAYRFDRVDAPEWLTEDFETQGKEGYLTGRANVTNIGVFEYRNQDGSIRRELRLPEHVLDAESVMSLRMKPVTNNHPPEMVTTDNIKKYQIGTTGGRPNSDGMHLTIDMSITDEKTIQDIQNGKQELSAGYTTEMLEESGVWMGISYDAIQTKIRYNHVAVVDRARAGDAARIKLRTDSADAVCVSKIDIKDKEDINMSGKETVSVRIDNMDFQVNPFVGSHINSLSSRADNLGKEKTDLEKKLKSVTKEHETLKGKFDGIQEQLKKSAELDPEKLKVAVKEKLLIMDAADLAKVEIKEDSTTRQTKESIIIATFPREDEAEYKRVLAEYSDDYINGKFDTAYDELKTRSANNRNNTQKLSGGNHPPEKKDEDKVDSLEELRKKNDEAEKKLNAELSNRWEDK